VSGNNPSQDTVLPATVSCPEGTKILGGGGTVEVSAANQRNKAALRASYPNGLSSWAVEAIVTQNVGSGNTVTVTVYAVCTA
jgi:hypothetical protein